MAKPAREEARLKPLEKAITPALRRLEVLEGFAFEKWIRFLHLETSRKGKGDFELSELKLGYWNRPRDASKAIEIDLVALDESNKKIRFGCCKRSESAHNFDSPQFSEQSRVHCQAKGYRTIDLLDYANLFGMPYGTQRLT